MTVSFAADAVRIIGVDQSLTSTGVAVAEGGRFTSVERVRPKMKAKLEGMAKREAEHQRLEQILQAIARHTRTMPRTQPIVGLEGPAMGIKGAAVVQIFGLYTLVKQELYRQGIPYYIVPPSTVKLYATGNGAAGKDDVLTAMVRRHPGVEFSGNDEADAMAIAAIGARYYGQPVEASTAYMARAMEKMEWPDV